MSKTSAPEVSPSIDRLSCNATQASVHTIACLTDKLVTLKLS